MGFGAFTAGFAEGFVDQTLSDRDRRLKQEDQLVQLGLASSMRQHEERTKKEQGHREMYSRATQLAQQLNLVGKESVIYNQLLLRGGNIDKVISDFQSGTLQPIPSTDMVRPTTDSTEAIDQQMMESGMTDLGMVGAPEPQTEQEQRGGFWSDVFATETGRKRRVDEQIAKQLELMGRDPNATPFNPPPPTRQLIMGGDTSNLIPLPNITNRAELERAAGIAAATPSVSAGYMAGLQRLELVLGEQESRAEFNTYLGGAKDEKGLAIAIASALAADASPETIENLKSVLEAVRTFGFEAPQNQSEWISRVNVASATGDTAELRFLTSVRNLYVSSDEPVLLSVEGRAVNAVPTLQPDGKLVYVNTFTGEMVEGGIELPSETREAIIKFNQQIASEVQSVQELRGLTLGFFDMAYDFQLFFEANPAAATATARLVSGVDQAVREANTILGVTRSFLGQNESVSEGQLQAQLTREGILKEGETLEGLANSFSTEDLIGANAAQLAEASRAYQAKLIIMAMRAGAAEGQSGRALTNSLFERLTQFIGFARTPEEFNAQMGPYLDNMYRGLVRDENDLVNTSSGKVFGFISAYGVNPLQYRTVDEIIEQDERLLEAANIFGISGFSRTPAPAPVEQTPQAAPVPAQTQQDALTQIMITPEMAARNPVFREYVGQTIPFRRQLDGNLVPVLNQ